MIGKYLLFFLFVLSFQQNNWTIGNNAIKININSYKDVLMNTTDYSYWTELRNSFYYSQNSEQLEKLVKYFTPEDENYYKNLFNFSAPGMVLAACIIIVLIIYLIRRFLLKGCMGPKKVVKSYHYTTYFLIAFGCLVGLIFHILSLYNAVISNSNIQKMLDEVESQKELMKDIYNNDIKNNRKLAMNDKKPTFKVDLSMYGENIIDKDFEQLQKKLENFTNDIEFIQTHKYNYQITSIVLFVIITAVGISGYWIRREYIPLIASILLLLLSAPLFAIAGLETTYSFLSIDFCSSISNSIISEITPSENIGLGSYLSCPSKETMRTLSTAFYQYIINFDSLYEQTSRNITYNEFFSILNIGNDKRDNNYFRELQQKISLINVTTSNPLETARNEELREDIKRSLNILININYILAGLLSMTSCFTAKNCINFIEENYCLKNHAYMFKNAIFCVFAGFGLIITAAGINKLIIVMRNRYSRALRGKKEFNTDIITEDDDD